MRSQGETASSPGLAAELVSSGLSVGVATVCTNPIDVVKVRVQLQRVSLQDGSPAPGLVRTGLNLVRLEGPSAFFKGVAPAVSRALLYGGIRLGLYQPFKKVLADSGAPASSLSTKIAAGCSAGAIAAVIANPTDLIKTRLQAKGDANRTVVGVVKQIVQSQGVVGLWKGVTASAARSAVLTASQCATYDEVKQRIKRETGWQEGVGLHLASSMVSGLATTTATQPIDMVKTHMFVRSGKFAGPLQCTAHILRKEGLQGLFKGWTANYARLGPQTAITFVVVEQLRMLLGLSHV